MADPASGALRIRRHGSFELALPPADAFKLFTAEGEKLWVPGWSPILLGPLPQQAGLVFLTGDGAEHTIWTVIDHDPVAGRVCYSRVTPASRAGFVRVQVTPANGGSRVAVEYDLTALDGEGAALQSWSPEYFSGMMAEWQSRILALPAEVRASLGDLVV
ncbi:hypothetical protein [Radicibacter daui]|uniref:hypothetical protein n=1 Tax=Radicibacter daui TaxID=3064829 RepID=UPI0040470116